jgi:hypothetical protein
MTPKRSKGVSALVLGVTLLLIAISSTGSSAEQSYYHTIGPLRGSLLKDSPVPIYSPDPNDSWNRIYHLLFSRRVEVIVEGKKVDRLEGGDIPLFFYSDYEIMCLLEDRRFGALVKDLEREIGSPSTAGRSSIAKILFQQDLWNRFDALFAYVHSPPRTPEEKPLKHRAGHLRDLVGKLIALTAPASRELRQLASNFDAVTQLHQEVDREFSSPETKWREVVEHGYGSETTRHAATAGFRQVFRVFIRFPDEAGGPANLETNHEARRVLPDGALARLIETPLVVTVEGKISVVPLITLVQSRTIGKLVVNDECSENPFFCRSMGDVFRILHGTRKKLISSWNRPGGGLEPIADDELVPEGGTAFRRELKLIPMNKLCPGCHIPNGRRLGAEATHGSIKGVLHPTNTIEEENVIKAKQASPDFQALQEYFKKK